jgi:hypothetical protein
VLVNLGDEEEPPKFWILLAAEANQLIVYEQLKTADVEAYLGQWGLWSSALRVWATSGPERLIARNDGYTSTRPVCRDFGERPDQDSNLGPTP